MRCFLSLDKDKAFHDQYLLSRFSLRLYTHVVYVSIRGNFSISAAVMSIALERNNSGGGHRIEGPGFARRDLARVSSIFDSPEFSAAAEEEDRSGSLSSSSSSSSIGKNSDEHPGSGSDEEEEVQSEYKGGPLDSLESLEEVLPIK